MPEAQYPLGKTLDPHIDEIVNELKELKWNVQKGVRYGIPYLRIKRTGFHHVIEFDSWDPHTLGLTNVPTDILPPTRKYWCWSALDDQYNPNTTGHLFYGQDDYFFKLRGAICSLGSNFSKSEMLEAIYIILWDPCKIPNSFVSLKKEIEPSSVCPVCTPPQDYKKIINDGIFPQEFVDNFISLKTPGKVKLIHKRFQSHPDENTLSKPIDLAQLPDRFQFEAAARKELRTAALETSTTSDIPEHYLFRRLHHEGKLAVQVRTWLVNESDPTVAHLGFDTNLGQLPFTNIPAIQTLCSEIWMTLPTVLDGDFGNRKPCLACINKSFVEQKFSQSRMNDLSWAQVTLDSGPKAGSFRNLEWGQPIITPSKVEKKTDWYLSAIESFGIYALPLVGELNTTLGMENEISDRAQLIDLIASKHPSSFKCIFCKAEQSISDLCEEFCTPASTSKYKFLVSLGSIVRLGPTVLCSDCRSLSFGTDYKNVGESSDALQALVTYKQSTGVIPDKDWRSRPVLKHISQNLSAEEKNRSIREAVMVAMAMPSGFEAVTNGNSKVDSWKVNSFNWWELLNRAGLVEKFKTTPRGKQGVSEDGHYCLSMLEWRFCNLLFKSGLEHQKEPRYTSTNQTRADYLIGDLYIEIAGLIGDEGYELKLKSKLAAAKVRKQRVLVFTPKGIEDLMKHSKIDSSGLEAIWDKEVLAGAMSSLAFH